MRICAALGDNLTLGRLAAAVQAALGQPGPDGELTGQEWDLISGDLLGDAYRAQVTPSLVRLDAFPSDLARHAAGAPGPARPAWYTCLAIQPGGRSAGAELLAALTVQWLTVRVTQAAATAPEVIIAGADEITRYHLEALADACERRGVPLTLLFRHLRDDATAHIGGAASLATAGHPGNTRPVTNAGSRPEIAPPGQRPASPSWRASPADAVPAWPPRPHPPRRPTQRD